jgi:hypothetical protein
LEYQAKVNAELRGEAAPPKRKSKKADKEEDSNPEPVNKTPPSEFVLYPGSKPIPFDKHWSTQFFYIVQTPNVAEVTSVFFVTLADTLQRVGKVHI